MGIITITADSSTLMRQAGVTISLWMREGEREHGLTKMEDMFRFAELCQRDFSSACYTKALETLALTVREVAESLEDSK